MLAHVYKVKVDKKSAFSEQANNTKQIISHDIKWDKKSTHCNIIYEMALYSYWSSTITHTESSKNKTVALLFSDRP